MLEGKGYYKGASILISGMAGSGKSTTSAQFADSICKSGDRCVYFAMEESPQQIVRNMKSIGLDLQNWVDKGLLKFSARRPNLYGLETHLATMYREVMMFDPAAVVVDPLSALMGAGVRGDVHAMVLRLVDFLKGREVTALFTNLGTGHAEQVTTEMEISSLMDTWLLLYNREANGEHNRQLYLLKSRGMAHSNQVREFVMSREGIKLREVYIGPDGVLTGSARLAQEAIDRARRIEHEQESLRRQRLFERKRREIGSQIEALQAQLDAEEQELASFQREDKARETQLLGDRSAMAAARYTTLSKPAAALNN
jgi:circadian clock protein KaiC